MFALPETSNNAALRTKLVRGDYTFMMTLAVNDDDSINIVMTREQVLSVLDNTQYVQAGLDRRNKIIYIGKA